MQTVFRRLFEDTKITTRFPKRHICNFTEINTLFAVFNNKGLGFSESDLTILYLKEWMLVNGNFLQA